MSYANLKDGCYRKGKFILTIAGGICVDSTDYKTINKAKQANRQTKYPVLR